MQCSATFEAGRLIWSKVRHAVAVKQAMGSGVRLIESNGFLFRDFTLIGDDHDVREARAAIEKAVHGVQKGAK